MLEVNWFSRLGLAARDSLGSRSWKWSFTCTTSSESSHKLQLQLDECGFVNYNTWLYNTFINSLVQLKVTNWNVGTKLASNHNLT